MVQAFVFLAVAGAAVSPGDKIDIVNVDFVADAIATLQKKRNRITKPITFFWNGSQTFQELTNALAGRAEQA